MKMKNILTKLTAAFTVILASAAFAADSPTLVCGLTGKEATGNRIRY